MRTLAALTTFTTLALAGAAGAQAPALTGLNWTLVSAQVDGQAFAPVRGVPVPTLRFGDRAVSGTTGCNTFQGPYAERGDVLRFGRLATTRRACPGAGAVQDMRFLNALRQVSGYQVRGQTLTLFAGSRDRLLFRVGGAAPAAEATVKLDGTWHLAGGTALSPVAGSVTFLTFAGNRVSGSAGCNRLMGSVEVQGSRVTFGLLATTRLACAPAVNTQESAFLRVVSGQTLGAKVQDQTLTLTGANGRTLVFRRAGTTPEGSRSDLSPAALLGKVYTLSAVNGRRPAATSQPVTLAFESGRLAGNDGCNAYSAPYRLEGTTLVLTGEALSTLRACPDQPTTVRVAALLAARPTVTFTAAGLTLRAEGTELTFTSN